MAGRALSDGNALRENYGAMPCFSASWLLNRLAMEADPNLMSDENVQSEGDAPDARPPRETAYAMRTMERADREQAAKLLNQGFPLKDVDFWRHCLDRQASVQNSAYGYFLERSGEPVGLVLTLRSMRLMPDGSELQILNLSSWYVEKAHRRRAVLMLRPQPENKFAVMTALTAATQIHSMIAAICPLTWSSGMIIASPAPFAAMPASRGTRMLPLHEAAGLMSAQDHAMLAWHAADGHIAGVMIENDAVHPLIFRVITRKGVRFAQLIFAPSRKAVLRNLPAVLRFLIRWRILFVTVDGDRELCPRGAFFRKGRPRFMGGTIDRDRLDYAYSELVLFGVS